LAGAYAFGEDVAADGAAEVVGAKEGGVGVDGSIDATVSAPFLT